MLRRRLLVPAVELTAHRLGVFVEHATRELSVTQAEANVLSHLGRHGAVSVAELQRHFGHKRSTLTSVLDRLERRGYVTRSVNPADRRSFLVSPTRSGSAAAARVTAELDTLEARLAARCSAAELEGFFAVVDAIGEETA